MWRTTGSNKTPEKKRAGKQPDSGSSAAGPDTRRAILHTASSRAQRRRPRTDGLRKETVTERQIGKRAWEKRGAGGRCLLAPRRLPETFSLCECIGADLAGHHGKPEENSIRALQFRSTSPYSEK